MSWSTVGWILFGWCVASVVLAFAFARGWIRIVPRDRR